MTTGQEHAAPRPATPRAVASGLLFDGQVECSILEDGRKLISKRGELRALRGVGKKARVVRRRLSPRITAVAAYLAQSACEAASAGHAADTRRLLRAALELTRPRRRNVSPTATSSRGTSSSPPEGGAS